MMFRFRSANQRAGFGDPGSGFQTGSGLIADPGSGTGSRIRIKLRRLKTAILNDDVWKYEGTRRLLRPNKSERSNNK
jgi:hypothetical protein